MIISDLLTHWMQNGRLHNHFQRYDPRRGFCRHRYFLCKHAKNKVNCILMSIQMNSICLKSNERSNSSCPLLSNLNMIRPSIYVPWMHLSLENERVRWSNRIVASILLHRMRVSWYHKDFGLRIFSLSYWNLQV